MLNNKVFAYCRLSSKEQNLDEQLEAVRAYCLNNNLNLDERDIFTDKASGQDFNSYQVLKHCLRKGDILVIKELDRLGCNIEMIKNEWNDLAKSSINIVVIDTPILNTLNKSDFEKNIIYDIVLELLSYISEKERQKSYISKEERQKIRQRQAEGIAIAKAKGKNLGRPIIEIDNKFIDAYNRWKNKEIKAIEAMELCGLKKSTFYSRVKEYENNK